MFWRKIKDNVKLVKIKSNFFKKGNKSTLKMDK